MRTIFKFKPPCIISEYFIESFLSVQYQDGEPVVWAIVDTERKPENSIVIYEIGTGWNCFEATKSKYIGTLQTENGYVWHYFYKYINTKENF